jgi:hypothetical protein
VPDRHNECGTASLRDSAESPVPSGPDFLSTAAVKESAAGGAYSPCCCEEEFATTKHEIIKVI